MPSGGIIFPSMTTSDSRAFNGTPKVTYFSLNFEAELSDNALSQSQRRQALAFLVHFVADVHQPLHVGRRDDRGGNSIKVNWRGKTFNLHQVWDSGLIADEKLSESAYVALIDRSSRAQQSVWQDSQSLTGPMNQNGCAIRSMISALIGLMAVLADPH